MKCDKCSQNIEDGGEGLALWLLASAFPKS